ncbi:hypothetical protein RFI_07145, partial [Reticulomyxa filosa]
MKSEDFVVGIFGIVFFPITWLIILWTMWGIYTNRKHVAIRARGYTLTMALIACWLLASTASYCRLVVEVFVWNATIVVKIADLAVSASASSVFLIFSRAFYTYCKWRTQNKIWDNKIICKSNCSTTEKGVCTKSRYFIITSVFVLVLFLLCGLFLSESSYTQVLTILFSVISVYGCLSILLSLTIKDIIAVRLEMIFTILVVFAMFPLMLVARGSFIRTLVVANGFSVIIAIINGATPNLMFYQVEATLNPYKKRLCWCIHPQLPSTSNSTPATTIEIISTSSGATDSEEKLPLRLIDYLKRGPQRYNLFAQFLVKCFASE